MRTCCAIAAICAGVATAQADAIRCDDLSTADVSIDGLLDDWSQSAVLARTQIEGGSIALRCSWDGTALAIALDVGDDRVVRTRGKGDEDHVDIKVSAGTAPTAVTVFPGTPIAKARYVAPARVAVADSLQPHGFSIDLRIPAARIAGLSKATTTLALNVAFHDSDAAMGGAAHDLVIADAIELGDRKDLLDDFLKATHLRKAELRLDTIATVDPMHRGKQRIVAGGTVIGVIGDQYAYVSLPAATAADVLGVELMALGAHGIQAIAARVRQAGNGGSRDLLMLWTVSAGQLQPLAQIEVRKQLGASSLEATWRIAAGKSGPELIVEAKPAIGFTVDNWNEDPATDADPILLPWDPKRSGIAYSLRGSGLARRELVSVQKKR